MLKVMRDDADDREHDDDYDALSADDVVEPHDSRSPRRSQRKLAGRRGL